TGHLIAHPFSPVTGPRHHPLAYSKAHIHGAELQGNAAILALFELLEAETPRGSLVLVPRVNPIASNQQVGDYVAGVYDLLTGANFNRSYLYLTGPSRSSSACYVDVDAFVAAKRTAHVGDIRSGFRQA